MFDEIQYLPDWERHLKVLSGCVAGDAAPLRAARRVPR